MKKSLAFGLVCAGLAISLIYSIRHYDRSVASLESDLLRVGKERDAADVKASLLEEKVAQLEASLADNTSTLIAAFPPEGDQRFENALEAWIGRVNSLTAYLKSHPEKRIPQMDLLSDEEWLDVTKGKFESEADFREALGKLRGLARQKMAADIGQALKSAIAANGGLVPTDPRELAAYLPAGFNLAILGQLSVNPSGQIPGMRSLDSDRFVLIDNAVDLWDSTLFYSTQGTYGMRSPNGPAQYTIKKAIANFTTAQGNPPTTVSQLLQDPAVSQLDPAARDEIFRALTTKPD